VRELSPRDRGGLHKNYKYNKPFARLNECIINNLNNRLQLEESSRDPVADHLEIASLKFHFDDGDESSKRMDFYSILLILINFGYLCMHFSFLNVDTIERVKPRNSKLCNR